MRALTSREKALLGGLCLALFVALTWTHVWQPALSSKDRSFAQLAKIDALQGILHRLPVADANATTPLAGSLRERVTNTSDAAGIDIRRLDPQGAALSVSLDKVPFDALVHWVDAMTSTAGIRVTAAEIGRLPEPGFVTARLLLETFG